MLLTPMRALDDAEGACVPAGLPPVVDAHVHLFPERVFEAVWRWFEEHAWPVRYKLHADAVLDFLASRGVAHVVALAYAHKPGMARSLNAWMAQWVGRPGVSPLGTVLPGEPEARAVVEEAFALGLRGLKLHCHVQRFAPDDPAVAEIYEACAQAGLPLVMHAGREPTSPAYACDPHDLCDVDRVEGVLRDHPRLKLCVPHLGADEFAAYAALLERHDHLWLDTTMALAGFFPRAPADVKVLLAGHSERLMYGTDFPNLPFAWDRELKRIVALDLPAPALANVLGATALGLFVGAG